MKTKLPELIENLKNFVAFHQLDMNTDRGLHCEISYCQGFVASLSGEDKRQIESYIYPFHEVGRSIL